GTDADHESDAGLVVVTPHGLDGELRPIAHAHEFAEPLIHGGAVHGSVLAVTGPAGGWCVDLEADTAPDAGDVACVANESGGDHGCLFPPAPVVVADGAAVQVHLGGGCGQVHGCAGAALTSEHDPGPARLPVDDGHDHGPHRDGCLHS